MSDFVFNIARGRVRMFFDAVKENSTVALPGSGGTSTANAALIVVPIETTGIEADDTLKDYDTLSALLAAANNEQTTMGRKTLADSVLTASSPDDTNNRLDLDIPDQTWSAATGNAVSKLIVCFDPDSSTGTDTTLIPLTAHDFTVTPDGSDITAQIASTGFYRSS